MRSQGADGLRALMQLLPDLLPRSRVSPLLAPSSNVLAALPWSDCQVRADAVLEVRFADQCMPLAEKHAAGSHAYTPS